MSAHTPGPWMALHDPEYGGPLICSEDVVIADVMEREGGESEANARLIAAAPELLAALKMQAGSTPGPDSRPCWCNEDDCVCRNRSWCVEARAAIAKAVTP